MGCATVLGASALAMGCGEGRRASAGAAVEPAVPTAAAPVSSDPIVMRIDEACRESMPTIQSAVDNATQVVSGSTTAAETGTVTRAVQEVMLLADNSIGLIHQAIAGGDAGAKWHAASQWTVRLQGLSAALRYFLYPESGPTTPRAARQNRSSRSRGR
jgi:hypothetical protein